MKRTALILPALAISFLAMGENFVKDGMEWRTEIHGTHDPSSPFVESTYFLKGDTVVDGLNAVKMYNTRNGETKLITVIRTDGDKVYFKNNPITSVWTLLYDFGLKVGEGCYVGMISSGWNATDLDPYTSYVKCTGYGELEGRSTILLEEYSTDLCEGISAKGTWLNGIGSPRGVTFSNGFDIDGVGSRLIEASLGGDILYKSGLAGIQAVEAFRKISARTEGLDLYVSGSDDPVMIHTTDGRLVKRIRTAAGQPIRLPSAGVYIITVSGHSFKLATTD